MKVISRLAGLLLLCTVLPLNAVVETYEFTDETNRERYHQFVDELRCPKCQNQNLAGSDSPIAQDLRRELHRLLEDGRSDREVVDYMVQRYGDFILYRPRFNAETAVLWFAPGVFLLTGAVTIILIFRRQKNKQVVAVDDSPLNEEEQKRLQELLAKDDVNA